MGILPFFQAGGGPRLFFPYITGKLLFFQQKHSSLVFSHAQAGSIPSRVTALAPPAISISAHKRAGGTARGSFLKKRLDKI